MSLFGGVKEGIRQLGAAVDDLIVQGAEDLSELARKFGLSVPKPVPVPVKVPKKEPGTKNQSQAVDALENNSMPNWTKFI